MHLRLGSMLLVLSAASMASVSPPSSSAQPAFPVPEIAAIPADSAIPEAPVPQVELVASDGFQAGQMQSESSSQPNGTGQQQNNSDAPAGSPATGSPQNSSSSQNSAAPSAPQQSQHDKAAAQIREQEKQRVAGILPSFNVSYRSDAVSMTASQKINLAFRSAVDPYTFGISFIVAGFSELQDEGTGFGWGPAGYFKRSGAAYLDAFDGAMIGNGFMPALLHQDPRYFRLGHGSFHHRLFYAIATSYICKHDNTGKWEPNYSNVGGNIIAGAISNLYYPSQTAGLGQTIDNGLIVTTEGTAGGILQEFWPDISRKFFHRDPTHGLDAQAAAADKIKKEQRKKSRDKAHTSGTGSTEN